MPRTQCHLICRIAPVSTSMCLAATTLEADGRHRVLCIQSLTIAWMTVEAVVSLSAAWRAGLPSFSARWDQYDDSVDVDLHGEAEETRKFAMQQPGYRGHKTERVSNSPRAQAIDIETPIPDTHNSRRPKRQAMT